MTSLTHADETSDATRRSRIAPAAIVAGTFFMETLDANIIVTALPAIAAEFGVSVSDASLGITAYVLALAIVLPASGWLSDRFGARVVFCAALAAFTLASLWCAWSSSFAEFTVARVLQGGSAALMSPVGRLVVLASTDKAGLMRAIATITWPGLIAPVIAPPLGGFITSVASWHWIFLVNVPLGLLGIALAMRVLPREAAGERKPFDGRGFLLGGGALGCLILGVERIGASQADGILAAGLIGTAMVLAVLSVRHAQRHKHALLRPELARIPTFALATLLAGSLTRIAIAGTPFLLPLLFQLGFGLGPLEAGLLVLVYMAGNLVMKAVTTPILRTFGFRRVLLANGALVSASIGVFALVGPATPVAVLWTALLIAGMTRSMQFTSLSTLSFADVPAGLRSAASMMSSVLQQVSVSLGVALSALALSLGQTVTASSADAFAPGFVLLALLAAAGTLIFLRLDRDAGAEVSGQAG
jgi:EmrB/QacA subfamily drug resistance transporter